MEDSQISEEEWNRLVEEIIKTIGRMRFRLKQTFLPIPVRNGKIVKEEELPRLRELLKKVV